MKTKKFGRTGLNITRMGLGAWAIGGDWEWGWSKQDDNESIATIRAALERGINWIDTAPAYGLGHSEKVVGRALKETPDSEKPFIFTKCGLCWKPGERGVYSDISAESILKEVDDSLKRLGVEVIDLYQIHWPDPDEKVEEAWETLTSLKESGKLRHIGVSNFSVSQLERAEAISPVETLQPNYSLLVRDIEKDILPWCTAHDVGVIVYSPMASGLLSGKMTRERIDSLSPDDWRKSKNDLFKEPKLTRNLALVEVLKDIAEPQGRSAGEVAIAWTLKHPAVTAAITGMRRPDQTAVTAAVDFQLSDKEAERLENVRLG